MTDASKIIALERDFWTTMAEGEHRKASAHLAGQSAMLSPRGVMTFTPDDYIRMGESGTYQITDWQFSDEKVVFPTPDSAIFTYRVRQTVEQDGKSETTTNQDTSVWLRDGSTWKCILHSEIPSQTQ